MISRRTIIGCSTAMAAALACAGLSGGALAQDVVDMALLAEESPLGDIVLGDPDAPVTVIEYGSLTCPHCAAFDTGTFPALQEQYIDTGIVKYIYRDYPLDPFGTGAAMLARCLPPENYYGMIHDLFGRRSEWVLQDSEAALAGLLAIALDHGHTEQSFDACLEDADVYAAIEFHWEQGDALAVSGTPTFFINGERAVGALPIEQIGAIIDAAAARGPGGEATKVAAAT